MLKSYLIIEFNKIIALYEVIRCTKHILVINRLTRVLIRIDYLNFSYAYKYTILIMWWNGLSYRVKMHYAFFHCAIGRVFISYTSDFNNYTYFGISGSGSVGFQLYPNPIRNPLN